MGTHKRDISQNWIAAIEQQIKFDEEDIHQEDTRRATIVDKTEQLKKRLRQARQSQGLPLYKLPPDIEPKQHNIESILERDSSGTKFIRRLNNIISLIQTKQEQASGKSQTPEPKAQPSRQPRTRRKKLSFSPQLSENSRKIARRLEPSWTRLTSSKRSRYLSKTLVNFIQNHHQDEFRSSTPEPSSLQATVRLNQTTADRLFTYGKIWNENRSLIRDAQIHQELEECTFTPNVLQYEPSFQSVQVPRGTRQYIARQHWARFERSRGEAQANRFSGSGRFWSPNSTSPIPRRRSKSRNA